ncbi:phage tail protein [Tenacibaculum aquimarinum]|uniref:phage tail protein n=1 Tax=Tenacibaculum aquimarinum TaxID=2910675 RepID=UPI001F0ADFFB|nr:tail fiber protein [Tenacibaculum aquimarinum]MCH3884708.1 tail fiber protein [Tenacibaculum aquimarinum]
MEPFIGQIQAFGFNFAPRGWALCNGQLLAISANSALFSLLGTTFGGDGRTSFGLPDLRGRSIVHVGNGPGLSNISWGEKGGDEQVYLNTTNMPSHNHTAVINATNGDGDESIPNGGYLANSGNIDFYAEENQNGVALNNGSITVGNTGGNLPFQNRNPFLGIYVSIAMQGIYPSRN